MKIVVRSLCLLGLVLLISGCSALLPGKKEFFQSKVPSFPAKEKLEEKTKEAAAFVAEKVTIAYDEGLKAQVTNTVMEPLKEAKTVAIPLADSVGHPETPYHGPATNLVTQMDKLAARYEVALHRLENKLDDLEGKKIEGTGAIQVGYFSYLAILLGIGAFLWFVLRIVSVFNPPVALGMQAVGVGGTLLRKGFTEVVHAGEKFKDMVKAKVEDPELQDHILALFKQAHMETQSTDVQHVVKSLTTNPEDPKVLAKALKDSQPNT